MVRIRFEEQLHHPDLIGAIEAFPGSRIAVLGDIMLDQYVIGHATRISPEAPVPVVMVGSEHVAAGGAANVAMNLAGLGVDPLLIGVFGDDSEADHLETVCSSAGISTQFLIRDRNRRTTTKTRVIASNQHVVRIDREETGEISTELEHRLISSLESTLHSVDGLVIQDYDKGLLSPPIIERVLTLAKLYNVPVFVDPKIRSFRAYTNVNLFKPNLSELASGCGTSLEDVTQICAAAESVPKNLNVSSIAVTLGGDGILICQEQGECALMETRRIDVVDVSGAGDTVIAVLAAAMVRGVNLQQGVTLANIAAGAVCEHVGTVPITRTELFDRIVAYGPKRSAAYSDRKSGGDS